MNRRHIRRCLGLMVAAAMTITMFTGCDDMNGKLQSNPLRPNWWINSRCSDTVIKTNKDVAALNVSIFATEGIGMVRPDKLSNITEAAVREMIEEASFPSKEYLNGRLITDAEKAAIADNRNLGDAEPSEPTDAEDLGQLIHLERYVTIRYAIATENADVRTYPTGDRLSNETGRHDYLLETGLYLGEPMAILWTSLDGNWFYAQAGKLLGDYKGSLFILHNTTTVNSDSGSTDAYACIITPIEAGATGATYLDRIDKAVLIAK